MSNDIPVAVFSRKVSSWLTDRARTIYSSQSKRRLFALGSLLVLLSTTVYWALLGARLQSSNADQLADPYMFSNATTFHGASFPGAHTFLLKWPIFWLLHFWHMTATSLLVATVAVCTLTVASLALVLYKIVRTPVLFGNLCLVLSLALLLIPIQPYAGGILPVNMAMLTTRNIEYIAYIVSLIWIIRAKRLRSPAFIAGTILLSLLITSDRLFLSLSGGGALLALIAYSLVHNWQLVTLSVRWVIASFLAAIGSLVTLVVIAALHVTHIAGQAGASPYALVATVKDLSLGAVYGLLGLLTNFGANPNYDNRVVQQLPHEVATRVFSLNGAMHIVVLVLLGYGIWLVSKLFTATFRHVTDKSTHFDHPTQLSATLLWSSFAAVGVFVATSHYYAVDARYLTIALFALFITAATALRGRKWPHPEGMVLLGAGLLIAIVASGFVAHNTYIEQRTALNDMTGRNQLIAQALNHHKVDVLVGDYWRVLPVKLASHNTVNADPLDTCTQPRAVLTSKAWQPDLTHARFAYLISLDHSLTGFPGCSLTQVTSKYGRPNATQLIAGTLTAPKEVLLFYDHGSHKTPMLPKRATSADTVLPITLDQLAGTNCSGPTIMNVVAHQDDDILFTSPDLLHDIRAGHCVRTVFLTAGDAGQGRFYWLNRQIGSEAAYSEMLHDTTGWVQHTVQISENQFITVASPSDNAKISLVFFNLPDGGLHGDGFPASHDQSLTKLFAGSQQTISSVDGQSAYSLNQLQTALVSLMNTFQPAEIRTQADGVQSEFPDHSDHIATGKIATVAANLYSQQKFEGALSIPIKYYIGYPIRGYESNISDGDLAEKEAAFLAYAQYDGGVCRTYEQCSRMPTYGAYISREYQESP